MQLVAIFQVHTVATMRVSPRALPLLCLLAAGLSLSEAGVWSKTGGRKVSETSVDEDNAGIPQPKTNEQERPHAEYGVDVSFPIHYASVSTNYEWLPHNQNPNVPTPKEYQDMAVQPLGNRQQFYKDFLQGCRDHFGSKGVRCTQNELDRVAMSLRQPQSMTNYTDIGFKSKCFDCCSWCQML